MEGTSPLYIIVEILLFCIFDYFQITLPYLPVLSVSPELGHSLAFSSI